jgi:hypothetical protein
MTRMKTLVRPAAVLLSLLASAPSIPAQTASAPATTTSLGAAMPGVTAQDMLTRSLDSVRLPLQHLLTRPDLPAADAAAIRAMIAALEATAQELAAALPPNADAGVGYSKGIQLSRNAQTLLEPRPDLALLLHQETAALASIANGLFHDPPELLLATAKQALLPESSLAAVTKTMAQFQADLAAAKRDAEKLAASPDVKSDPDKMRALYLQHSLAMENLASKAALALEANLPPADLQAFHAALILRVNTDPFYVTFSTAAAPVSAPLDGAYQLRLKKTSGIDTVVDTATLTKGTPLSFKDSKAFAGTKETPIGEGLYTWVLVKK